MSLTVFRIRRGSTSYPRRSREQIYRDVEKKVAGLRDHPHMFFAKPNIKTAVTFLQGFDEALHGVPLAGFLYWLELKTNPNGAPRHWIAALPIEARKVAGPAASPDRVLEEGCRLLEKFFAYRRRYGTKPLMAKYIARRRKSLSATGAKP